MRSPAEPDHVLWHTLTHAYGPAEDVPEQIRALYGTDEDVVDEALWELHLRAPGRGKGLARCRVGVRPTTTVLGSAEREGKTADGRGGKTCLMVRQQCYKER